MKAFSITLFLIVWRLLSASATPSYTAITHNSSPNTYVNEIFITNFKIEGSTQPIVPTPYRSVTYSLTMSKPHGYHGRVYVIIIFGDASGATQYNTGVTAARIMPPDIASFPNDGWTDGNNGRDYYDVTATHPSPGPGNNDASFNTSVLANNTNPNYTHLYAIAINTSSTTYADPGAVRGLSTGIKIGLPCISDNYVQNVNVPSTVFKQYSAGQTLFVGRNVTNRVASGDVTVQKDGAATFIARDAIALQEGVNILGGTSQVEFYIFSSICSESSLIGDNPPSDSTQPSIDSFASSGADANSRAPTPFSDEQREDGITIYPNPTSAVLNFNSSVESITIFDEKGRQVLTVKKVDRVDMQTLPNGLYNLQVWDKGILTNHRIQVKH